MAQTIRLSKAAQTKLAKQRKGALAASGRTYADLARLADVSYSMVDKWMNARRTSKECQRAFEALTTRQKVAS